jgi:hypothetical protein
VEAITRELIAVTNTAVVNTETMCELLRKLAAQGLSGPITVVLDNARYHLDGQRLGVLADALEEAGCTDPALLGHLRDRGLHVRGCHVVDLLLGKS